MRKTGFLFFFSFLTIGGFMKFSMNTSKGFFASIRKSLGNNGISAMPKGMFYDAKKGFLKLVSPKSRARFRPW